VKRPDGLDSELQPATGPAMKDPPAETVRDPAPSGADLKSKPDADLTPEQILEKRGLKKEGRFYVSAAESRYAAEWQGAVPFYNVMHGAWVEYETAVRFAVRAQELQDAQIELNGAINQLRLVMGNSRGFQRAQLQGQLNEATLNLNAVNTELAEVRTRVVSRARMEELKGQFLKARADFLDKSRELKPIRKAMNEEYAALRADADVTGAIKALKARGAGDLGPSDRVKSMNLQLSQAEEEVSFNPDAYRRPKKSPKRKGSAKD
jgi:hypothetical protein